MKIQLQLEIQRENKSEKREVELGRRRGDVVDVVVRPSVGAVNEAVGRWG